MINPAEKAEKNLTQLKDYTAQMVQVLRNFGMSYPGIREVSLHGLIQHRHRVMDGAMMSTPVSIASFMPQFMYEAGQLDDGGYVIALHQGMVLDAHTPFLIIPKSAVLPQGKGPDAAYKIEVPDVS